MSAAQALHSPQFVALALTFFCCCAARSGPIFHMVSHAIGYGWPYLGAFGVAVGAMAVALAFPPLPSRRASSCSRREDHPEPHSFLMLIFATGMAVQAFSAAL